VNGSASGIDISDGTAGPEIDALPGVELVSPQSDLGELSRASQYGFRERGPRIRHCGFVTEDCDLNPAPGHSQRSSRLDPSLSGAYDDNAVRTRQHHDH
jgi:hypothetical protein